MKALIATGLGVLALGGLLVANSGRSASALQAQPATLVNPSEANRTTLVNCGEGRQAMVSTDARTGLSQVQCVGAETTNMPGAAVIPGVATEPCPACMVTPPP